MLFQASRMLSHTLSPVPQTWEDPKKYLGTKGNLACAKRVERSRFHGCHLSFKSDAMKELSPTYVCDPAFWKLSHFWMFCKDGPVMSCRREYCIRWRRCGPRNSLRGGVGTAAVASIRRSSGAGGENAGEPSSPASSTPSSASSSTSSAPSGEAVPRGDEKREEKEHN